MLRPSQEHLRPMAVIPAVNMDPEIVAVLKRDLSRRFAADYDIIVLDGPSEGIEGLHGLGEGSTAIALIHQYLREDQEPARAPLRTEAMDVCELHVQMRERNASHV